MSRTRPLLLAVAAALIAVLPTAAASADTQTKTCKGSAQRCTVSFSLTGGASNRQLVIRLPDTDLKLLSVVARPRDVRGAYDLSDGRFRLGGSEYVVTLNAVQSIGPGARLTFTFGAPATAGTRACGDLSVELAGATVRAADIRARGLGCPAAKRITRRCISATGPSGGWTITQSGRRVALVRRGQRVTFRLVDATQSCAPSG